jgi:hypothetical protein
MKQLFIGAGALFIAAILLSFTDVHNNHPRYAYSDQVLSVPVKQKAIVIVNSVTRCNQLLKKGFICQDVDIVRVPKNHYDGVTVYYYTMIKY